MYVLRLFVCLLFCMCVCVCVCVCLCVLFLLLQNAPIAMIFDGAIYLFIYFYVIASKSHTKTIQKMGERNQKTLE